MLDIETEVRKSKIEGKGVFALRDFKPGEIVIAWDTSNTLSEDEYARLPEDQRRYVVRFKGQWLYMMPPSRYVNHSCDANTRALNGADVAIKEIHAGEEITSDYRSEMKLGEKMECHCGAATCIGYIVGIAA
jgi:SET domain-containing protein